MAITVNNTPNSYQSFHEDLWFVVTSDNIAQTSFKYVFDVYINSVLVARIKSFPQPNTDKGLFNVAPIIRNYWESYFQPATSQTAFNYNGSGNVVSFTIQFGEEYAGTLYSNLTSSAGTGYNYYPNISEGKGAFDGTWFDTYYGGKTPPNNISNAFGLRSKREYPLLGIWSTKKRLKTLKQIPQKRKPQKRVQ